MDVLNNIALPQSTEHFHLLLFIYNVVMAVAVPYLALLTGTVLLAVWSERRSGASGSGTGAHMSRRMLDAVLPAQAPYLFLGLLPALALVFVHAQLFQGTRGLSTGFAALGVLFLAAAGVAAFAYRYTYRVEDALSEVKEGAAAPAAVGLAESARLTRRRSGTTAVVAVLGMIVAFSAAQAISLNRAHWRDIDSVPAALLSADVWLWVLMFLSLAAAMTGAGLLFFGDREGLTLSPGTRPRNPAEEQTGVRLSTGALLIVPFVLLLTLVRLPDHALSGWVYVLAAAGVLFLFAGLHALYAYVSLARTGSAAYLFAAVILATTALVTKDQVALRNVTKEQAVALAVAYDDVAEGLKSSLGVAAKQLTGQEIYDAKCSACHLFDQKKVGPPYLEVVPKYKGNKAGLAAFILNPVKVNPAYPPMPSQGLKPSEADSIATYLLNKVGAGGS